MAIWNKYCTDMCIKYIFLGKIIINILVEGKSLFFSKYASI